ncbi:MAG: hypothetical protein SPE88_06330 [Paludibacteraceae bacterium]|nr:hypothetical protein [Paludibacteraceae bacterium]
MAVGIIAWTPAPASARLSDSTGENDTCRAQQPSPRLHTTLSIPHRDQGSPLRMPHRCTTNG